MTSRDSHTNPDRKTREDTREGGAGRPERCVCEPPGPSRGAMGEPGPADPAIPGFRPPGPRDASLPS